MNPHEKIQKQIELTMAKVESGHMNPLDALLRLRRERDQLKMSLEMIDTFERDNMESIDNEVKSYGGKYQGFDIQVRSGGRSWSYKHIPEWQDINEKKKELEDRYKTYWNSRQKGALIATEDGEEIPLPEVSYRKASIVIKQDRS